MSNVTLKHKITENVVSMPCEQWDAQKDVPEIRNAFEVIEGSAGCTTCGSEPEVEEEKAPETKPAKSAAKNTSKESE